MCLLCLQFAHLNAQSHLANQPSMLALNDTQRNRPLPPILDHPPSCLLTLPNSPTISLPPTTNFTIYSTATQNYIELFMASKPCIKRTVLWKKLEYNRNSTSTVNTDWPCSSASSNALNRWSKQNIYANQVLTSLIEPDEMIVYPRMIPMIASTSRITRTS